MGEVEFEKEIEGDSEELNITNPFDIKSIKNENILAYKYSDEIIKYINDLEEYVAILKGKSLNSMVEEEKNKDDKQLALLFGIHKDLEFI